MWASRCSTALSSVAFAVSDLAKFALAACSWPGVIDLPAFARFAPVSAPFFAERSERFCCAWSTPDAFVIFAAEACAALEAKNVPACAQMLAAEKTHDMMSPLRAAVRCCSAWHLMSATSRERSAWRCVRALSRSFCAISSMSCMSA